MSEDLPEPDFDFDENGPQEPDYWACYGCGTTTGKRQMGNMCPKCGAYMEEENY